MAMIPLSGKNPSIDFIEGIDINNPQNGQAIVYDAASGTWKNANAGGGGGGSPLVTVAATIDTSGESPVWTLSKTVQEILDMVNSGQIPVVDMPNNLPDAPDWPNGIGLLTYVAPRPDGTGGAEGYDVVFGDWYFVGTTLSDYPTIT